jgi:hypothetical protein
MRRALSLLVVLTLLAACAGGDDGGGESATTPSTTAPPQPPALFAGHESEIYVDAAHWLCRGDVADDACDVDLDATVVEADGSATIERFEPLEDADVDCFYVYPTISRDEAAVSDLEPSEDEELDVVRQQAARLGSVCRVWAPVYRQATLTALVARFTGATPPPGGERARETAYGDVADAFKHYMAKDNGGRGVVLVGHSQGAGLLNRLIREEVDGVDEVRERLVSALLLGSTVVVPEGEDVGGDFANVPLCRSDDDVGCVLSYATFRSTAPPPANSFFGRPRDGEGVAACTNPASLEGGPGPLRPYFPRENQSILGGEPQAVQWATGLTVETPFVSVPGLVTAECLAHDGFSYLAITVEADPDSPRVDEIGGDLTPEWGLHLVDVNLAMGDLVAIVGRQAEAWLAG